MVEFVAARCISGKTKSESPQRICGKSAEERFTDGAPRKYLGISRIQRGEVRFEGKYKPGDIVINTKERGLYIVEPNGYAIRYGIGVGRAGFQWGGVHKVTAKKENPD
jgi:lipoprotein-anchoring transpeptidase ErfK/SrfK